MKEDKKVVSETTKEKETSKKSDSVKEESKKEESKKDESKKSDSKENASKKSNSKKILLRRQQKQPVPLPIRSRRQQNHQHLQQSLLLQNLHQVRIIKEIPVRQRRNQHISTITLHRHIRYIMMRLDTTNSMLYRQPMMSR